MTTLKELTQQAKDPDLLLTPKINEYLMSGKTYTQEAMETVWTALTTPGRDRRRSFSASSAGTCLRRQELTFLGYPQKSIPPNLQVVFDLGNWFHAGFQAKLLSADLIHSIEVPLDMPDFHAKGSMDGQGHVWWKPANPNWADKEFVLEIKTVGSHMWEKMAYADEPKEEHLRQIHRYFLVSGLRLCSYIMIDKGNQSSDGFRELVVEADDKMLDESAEELEELNYALDQQKLHPILPSCKIGTGTEWKYCPFTNKRAGACHNTSAWQPYQG